MKRIALSLFAVAVVAGVVVAGAQTFSRTEVKSAPQSAKEVRGASPYIEITNEPAPKLIVDPPLPDLLDQGVVWIQWRAENVHISRCSGRVPSTHLHESGICTSMWTTCRGGGRTRVTSTRSTWPGCRRARTRSGSSWSTPTTRSSPGSPRR